MTVTLELHKQHAYMHKLLGLHAQKLLTCT
jgi:hypothetical protein